jgi:hypothetical protein
VVKFMQVSGGEKGFVSLNDRLGELERGGIEWEPIKILLEEYGNSNKTNTISKTRL